MTKYLLSAFLLIAISSIGFSQNELWTDNLTTESDWGENKLVPDAYHSSTLNLELFRDKLKKIDATESRSVMISLPTPSGDYVSYSIHQYQMMENNIAEKYSDIKTFKGYSLENIDHQVYFTLSSRGIDGIINTKKGAALIHSINDDNSISYASYWMKDYPSDVDGIVRNQCDAIHTKEEIDQIDNLYGKPTSVKQHKAAASIDLLNYRVAIATTGEFTRKYGGTKASVMIEVVSILNKVNMAMNRDFGINLTLIDNTDEVFYLVPSQDPYTNNSAGALLSENGPVLRNRIGSANYDLGHVFGTNSGGLASLGSICRDDKENGASGQFGNYSGSDFFIIVAHEMGHQLTGAHTFNWCDGNENSGTAYEPGSGNTIMSYSGAGCAMWNQRINDAYYHINTIHRVHNYTREGLGGASCAQSINTSNHYPVVDFTYQDGFFIPKQTPFELTGFATDEDGDDMTYTWEQYDLGPQVPTGELPFGEAPHFKFNPPTDNPTRVFPSLDNLVSNRFFDRLDYLPDSSRTLTFRFTARDNNDEVGAVSWQEMEFFVTHESGPFRIIEPSNGESMLAGAYNFVSWNPSNTRLAPVSCDFVDIMISTDNGYTYLDTLQARTANDGRALVFLPESYFGQTIKLKIKSSDNIFFDISNRVSPVVRATEPAYYAIVEPQYQELCLPESAQIIVETKSILGYSETVFVDYTASYTDGVTITVDQNSVTAGENLIYNIEMDDSTTGDTLDLDFIIYNTKDTFTYNTRVYPTSNNFSDQVLNTPINGAVDYGLLPNFSWEKSDNAVNYQFQLATNASFAPEFIVYETITRDNQLSGPITLDGATLYQWRVNGINKCGTHVTNKVSTFNTKGLACRDYSFEGSPVRIPSSGTSSVELELTVLEAGIIGDLNVHNVTASHNYVGDLTGFLVSPLGTEITLWSKTCANRTTINATFDDEAETEFGCLNLTNGTGSIRPVDPLANFNAEDQFGVWKLVVEDDLAGSGGELQGFDLEICSSYELTVPIKNNIDTLFLKPNTSKAITEDLLKYSIPGISDRDVIFQITVSTTKGELKRNGTTLTNGKGFRMTDIQDGKITYVHGSDNLEKDEFQFLVYNISGGLAGQTETFHIRTTETGVNVFENETIELNIYPNPNNINTATIDLPTSGIKITDLNLVNSLGQQVEVNYTKTGDKINLKWTKIPTGVYYVKMKSEDETYSASIIITD